MLHEKVVEVLAAQVTIATRCQRGDPSVLYFEDGDVQGATAKVKDNDLLLSILWALVVKTVGQRRCCRLIDHLDAVEASDDTCILCRPSLYVIEVGGDSDHTFGYFSANSVRGRLFQLVKHLG